MTSNDEEFEQSLEAAIELIARQSTLDGQERSRLGELLESIADYRPRLEIPQEHPLRSRLAALSAHLDAFEKRREEAAPDPGPAMKGRGGLILPG